MSDIETGGNAFPGVGYKEPIGGGSHLMTIIGGMTLRDYFAAKAMQAFMSDKDNGWQYGFVAQEAYRQADAMLEARK